MCCAAASAGCGGSAGAPDPGAFASSPAATLTSDSGLHRIAVYSAPDAQPTRGVNALRIVITNVEGGRPATGLDLDVVPWMPAMGHGASVKPRVETGTEPGVFTVTRVNLFMPGLWEIRTSIGGATQRDHATAQFEVH